MTKKFKVVGCLEEGKTYHVIVGDKEKNIFASEKEIDEVKNYLKKEYPKFGWIVTNLWIQIGEKNGK